MADPTVVVDTSVLLNFLKIDRMDLLGRHPGRLLVTDHVEAEITESVQRGLYLAAVAAGHLAPCTVTDPEEVALFMRLATGKRLGAGECAAIAVALHRQHPIAIDDNKAISRALREAGLAAAGLTIIRTQDVVARLIREGVIDVAQADAIKAAWEQHHRFRLKIGSFSELL